MIEPWSYTFVEVGIALVPTQHSQSVGRPGLWYSSECISKTKQPRQLWTALDSSRLTSELNLQSERAQSCWQGHLVAATDLSLKCIHAISLPLPGFANGAAGWGFELLVTIASSFLPTRKWAAHKWNLIPHWRAQSSISYTNIFTYSTLRCKWCNSPSVLLHGHSVICSPSADEISCDLDPPQGSHNTSQWVLTISVSISERGHD